MSIDARIAAVTVIAPERRCPMCGGSGKDPATNWDSCQTCHGATKDRPVVRLRLEPRASGGLAGQPSLTIVDPPTVDPDELGGLVGTEIWGNSSAIMVGQQKWADRLGYTKIRLVAHGREKGGAE